MKSKLPWMVLAACIAIPSSALGGRAIDLFDFDGNSGYAPWSGVIADNTGMLFGGTTIGGNGPCLAGAGCGTLYAMIPSDHGRHWTPAVLYNFQGGQDGGFVAAPLTLDGAGGVYGYDSDGTPGTVFEVSPPKHGGSWTFRILYVFDAQADGNLTNAFSPLVLHGGALFGLATGGVSSCGQFGCVFELKQKKDGSWVRKTVYAFTGGQDSGQPSWIAGFDSAGALYATTTLGKGAVVKLTPPEGGGTWTESVITQFTGAIVNPTDLLLAPDGTLYGIAGRSRSGIVFQLTPQDDGMWERRTIAKISEHHYGPASLAFGPNGTLIGVIEGDFDFYAGNVFQLTPGADGAWTYTELWNFNRGPDRNPVGVTTGLHDHLFGVLGGGDSSNGSVFELH
jgi:hypothetical protein